MENSIDATITSLLNGVPNETPLEISAKNQKLEEQFSVFRAYLSKQNISQSYLTRFILFLHFSPIRYSLHNKVALAF